ncbi:hypothetical protein MCOR01_011591 [Pyricularia oryzae]|nr:hypothetical protein MCOR01_011591 [Pyricularia oryzae]
MIAAIKEKASRVKSQLPISSPIYPPTSSIPSLTTKNSAISDAASNQTLGTDKIAFINLPHRHDRFDAIALQSHLSGIQITRFPAVDVSQLRNNGLPPTENPNRLKDTEKGCWRAHANVWQHMLEHQIPAVVDPSDPWLARSDTWDLLSIGHCSDGRNSDGKYVVYDDPDAPHKNWRYDPLNLVLNGQRIVYRANNVVCTTGYLVSLSGAARMLVRTTWNLEHPVDLIIALMAGAGELRAYTQQQVLVAQWEYIEGIKSGGNSDIHDGGNHGRKKSKDEEQRSKEAWEESKKTHNSYQIKSNYRHSDFNDFALGRAWNHIMENKS